MDITEKLIELIKIKLITIVTNTNRKEWYKLL